LAGRELSSRPRSGPLGHGQGDHRDRCQSNGSERVSAAQVPRLGKMHRREQVRRKRMPMRRCRSQKGKISCAPSPLWPVPTRRRWLLTRGSGNCSVPPLQMRISRWPSRVPGGIFAKLTRRRLKRGIFRSVAELKQAINSFNCSNNPRQGCG
jgi:hypothetical protein